MSDPHDILQNLKVSGNLPSMPQILVRLIDACHQPDIDLQSIGQVVEKDAALSAKILQLCNSAYISSRSTFGDVTQAVIYLGANTIRDLAISVSIQQVFRRVETNGLLSIDRFWYHSYRNAILAQRIAFKVNYPIPAEAHLCGLLHDIGKLLLWMAFPGKYAPLLLKGVRCHSGRLAFLEQEKLHINHCEAGAWLANQWQLPSLYADAIRYHHHALDEIEQGLPLARIVYLSDLLSHADEPDSECEIACKRLFDLNPTETAQLLHGLDEEAGDVAAALGIRVSPKEHSSLEQDPESENIHKETSAGLISRVRDMAQMNGVLEKLLRAENREQILLAIEESLKILFNESTSLLLLLDENSGELLGITSQENKLSGAAQQVRIHLERHNKSLPVQAFAQRRMMHSFMEDVSKIPNMLNQQMQHLLETDGMVAVPLAYQQKNLGVLIIGLLEDSHQSLLGQSSPLQLLAGQAAAGLYLDQVQNRQAVKIAAERLEAASMVGRKIAHEINNPLAILRNYMKILELKIKDNSVIKEELAIIDSEFDRIGQITQQLRNLSSEEEVTLSNAMDLNQLVGDTIRLFTMSMPRERGITINFDKNDDLPRISTDANRLRQVMINLLGNAADALLEGGVINVSTLLDTGEEKKNVRIVIQDNGPGIPERFLANIFSAGITTKGDGHAGLGLAIVQKIINELGGTITCSSIHGKGTTFSIALPTRHT